MKHYEVVIIGGGLAGLALSIQLARMGRSVLVLEKGTFPSHKVCGEYLSLESIPFLKNLGLDLEAMSLPVIKDFELSSPSGKLFKSRLPLGGIGISRYLLDQSLATLARSEGVRVEENATALDVEEKENKIVIYSVQGNKTEVGSDLVCGAFGKKSNLDIKWNRRFLAERDPRLDNYVGIKYHVQGSWKSDTISLHNFSGGYCGFSKIEEEKFCLCYLTHASALKPFNGSISNFEKEHLCRNPLLKNIFSNSSFLEGFPLTISQVNFKRKEVQHSNVFMLGDSAGTIPPLCGNGMSMAFHSAKIFAPLANQFLKREVSFDELNQNYKKEWSQQFAGRLWRGRFIQRFFGSGVLTETFVRFFKAAPFLAKPVIRSTHGSPF